MIHMNRIDPPGWRGEPRLDLTDDPEGEAFSAFKDISTTIMEIVHQTVENYVNNDDMTHDSEWFPSRDVLSGSYYVYGASYRIFSMDGIDFYRMRVECVCTEIGQEVVENREYLGLDIDIHLRKGTEELTVGLVSSAS